LMTSRGADVPAMTPEKSIALSTIIPPSVIFVPFPYPYIPYSSRSPGPFSDETLLFYPDLPD
jgi:hypothetical protein